MSDTPETDMFNGCWATERINGETIFGLAQRLERERNKAAECAESLNDIADLLDMPTGTTPSEIVETARSRWKTKTKPMKYCDMCAIPSICSERRKCRYSKEQTDSPSDTAACSVVAPNLVQAGDLWLMEDEDAYHPDKMEYSLLIQCANAEQVRDAMRTGKIEFTIFAHYPQNVTIHPPQ